MFKKLLSRSVLFAWLSLLMSEIMVGPALGQRPGRQGSDDPPELHAVWHGVQGIDAFVKAGEKFIGQKNEYGQTAAMLAAIRGLPEIVEAFLKAGGKFTEAKDKSGRTAAMYIVNLNSGPGSVDFTKPVDYDARCRVIEIFSRVGGRFTDDRDVYGRTAAMDAVSNPKVIAAFVKAGGRFTNQQDSSGYTAAMGAVMYEAENVRAFARAGGKFTSQSNAVGQTAEDIPAGRGSDPLTPNRGRSVLDAYREAVRAQGGLIYISTDDEFTALRNPRAIESFVKSGKHFDNGPDKDGMTAAMLAIGKGPKTLEAFIAFGGKFTTQQNKNGETAAKIASNYNSTRYPGILDVYDEAVRKQGGLVSVTPVDEYEAVRMGPPGIDGFIKAGKFTDHPNRDDLTSAMIAAARSPEVITAFAKAGGRFTDTQNKLGYTAAMVAVLNGPDATKAFARAGGHFTEQQDHHGRTAGMLCASRQDDYFPPAAMELKLTPRLMKGGLVNEGGAAIQAFAEAGGRFTDQQDSLGRTAAMQAVFNGPEAIRAFAKAGGAVHGEGRRIRRDSCFLGRQYGRTNDHRLPSGWGTVYESPAFRRNDSCNGGCQRRCGRDHCLFQRGRSLYRSKDKGRMDRGQAGWRQNWLEASKRQEC